MINEIITWLREQIAETQRSPQARYPYEAHALCQALTEIVDRHKPIQLHLPWDSGYSCEGCRADLEFSPGGLCPDVLSLVQAYRHCLAYSPNWPQQ